jgi:hypothetical protein
MSQRHTGVVLKDAARNISAAGNIPHPTGTNIDGTNVALARAAPSNRTRVARLNSLKRSEPSRKAGGLT